MFIIIGGDGKEYGPASAHQVRAWIAAGRANLETKAKLAGSEDWRTLGEFPEFGGVATPPPIPLAGMAPDATAGFTSASSAVPAAVEPPLADPGLRLLARLIDWLLEIVVSLPGLLVLGGEILRLLPKVMQGQSVDFADFDTQRLITGTLLTVAGGLALLVVQVWMLSTRGQSIGKRLVGVRIVRFSDNAKVGFVNAWLVRELCLTLIGFVLSMLPLVGLFLRPMFHLVDWCLIFRDDRRCLHDLLAGTKVVKA